MIEYYESEEEFKAEETKHITLQEPILPPIATNSPLESQQTLTQLFGMQDKLATSKFTGV